MGPPSKKRKTEPKVEEITFDTSSRQEYLTGFHKRKLQRAKFAQEKAAERARLERIEERKKLREDRKAELERHVQAVNEMLQPLIGDGDKQADRDSGSEAEDAQWSGLEDVAPEPVDHEAEYIDEDKYTTVTVETMDITRDGLMKAEQNGYSDSDEDRANQQAKVSGTKVGDSAGDGEKSSEKRKWQKDRPKDKPHKPKKKRNFRYESKTERKMSRTKQRLKNSQQAKARREG